eukprot:404581_1
MRKTKHHSSLVLSSLSHPCTRMRLISHRDNESLLLCQQNCVRYFWKIRNMIHYGNKELDDQSHHLVSRESVWKCNDSSFGIPSIQSTHTQTHGQWNTVLVKEEIRIFHGTVQ